MIRKVALPFLMFSILLGLFSSGAFAVQEDLERLLEERTAVLYVEGQKLGNLIIGARAKLEFIYVDAPLVRAVKESDRAPSWLEWHVNKYGSDEAKGKSLFILRVETFKPFTLVPEMITINDLKLSDENVLTRKEFAPLGELPSSFSGALVLAIPRELVRPGQEVKFSCGGGEVTWVAPKK